MASRRASVTAGDDRKALLLGSLVCGLPIAAFAIWISTTGPTTDPPDYGTPSQPRFAWTPSPPPTGPIGEAVSAVQDCGDGTEGTFAECWQRLGSANPTPTPWERTG